MYEVGTTVAVRAFHVMPGMPPPEGERHSHDYRLDVVVRREELNDQGMVVDLDRLGEALRSAADRVAGADLDQVIPTVNGVTVEVFARWVHGRLCTTLGQHSAAALRVRVWESPTAFGGYAAPLADCANHRVTSSS